MHAMHTSSLTFTYYLLNQDGCPLRAHAYVGQFSLFKVCLLMFKRLLK